MKWDGGENGENGDVHVLGADTEQSGYPENVVNLHDRRPSPLGAAAQRWLPRDYHYYVRQWEKQQGAWGNPEDVAEKLAEDIADIQEAFRSRGTQTGLRLAKQRGLLPAARFYVDIRALTEEQLAAKQAELRARFAKAPTLPLKLREAFATARLAEVRAAQKKGETPPQAVVDKPEIPRKQIPRWVTWLGLTLSVISFARSFRR